LNRGNARQTMFHKQGDFEAFERTLAEGLDRYPVQLYSFCLMPNHWHLVLSPQQDGMMGRAPEPHVSSPWPLRRSADWVLRVNEALSEKERSAIRESVNRERPYGDEQWTERMADRHGLWSTLRPLGRPRKSQK